MAGVLNCSGFCVPQKAPAICSSVLFQFTSFSEWTLILYKPSPWAVGEGPPHWHRPLPPLTVLLPPQPLQASPKGNRPSEKTCSALK